MGEEVYGGIAITEEFLDELVQEWHENADMPTSLETFVRANTGWSASRYDRWALTGELLSAEQPVTVLRRRRDDEGLTCGPCSRGRHIACTDGVVTSCECRHRDDESASGARDGVGDE